LTSTKSREEIQLHAFGDASEKAYGATVYLRVEYATHIYCSLLASKTRVAPMKEQTILRLELQASLITARLAEQIKKYLRTVIHIDELILWSDSYVAFALDKKGNKETETVCAK
jgi:hypothetical protein